jgi:hypothetical protein
VTLLGPPRRLLDIDDLETFCSGVISKVVAANGSTLSQEKRDAAVSWMIGAAFILSIKYRPGVGTFHGYAARYLELRTADWYRQTFGDARAKHRAEEVSLDGMEESVAARSGWEDEVLDRVALGS